MVNIKELLGYRESLKLECKAAKGGLPNSTWETYSAFANSYGGVILLGVDELPDKTFQPVGVKDAEMMINDIWNTVNNKQKVSLSILSARHVYAQDYEGVKIVVIEVPRADRHMKPVFINKNLLGGTYRRNGEGDYHCTEEEVRNMVRDQSDLTQDTKIIPELGINDLNKDTVNRYRTRFNNLKPGHVWADIGYEDFLFKIGAIRRGEEDGKLHPTAAGLLMFGDEYNIVSEFPNYFLDYREKMDETNRWSDRVISNSGDWSGNLFDFYYKILDRLTSDIKVPFRLENGVDRIDDTDVHKAMREALAKEIAA